MQHRKHIGFLWSVGPTFCQVVDLTLCLKGCFPIKIITQKLFAVVLDLIVFDCSAVETRFCLKKTLIVDNFIICCLKIFKIWCACNSQHQMVTEYGMVPPVMPPPNVQAWNNHRKPNCLERIGYRFHLLPNESHLRMEAVTISMLYHALEEDTTAHGLPHIAHAHGKDNYYYSNYSMYEICRIA